MLVNKYLKLILLLSYWCCNIGYATKLYINFTGDNKTEVLGLQCVVYSQKLGAKTLFSRGVISEKEIDSYSTRLTNETINMTNEVYVNITEDEIASVEISLIWQGHSRFLWFPCIIYNENLGKTSHSDKLVIPVFFGENKVINLGLDGKDILYKEH